MKIALNDFIRIGHLKFSLCSFRQVPFRRLFFRINSIIIIISYVN